MTFQKICNACYEKKLLPMGWIHTVLLITDMQKKINYAVNRKQKKTPSLKHTSGKKKTVHLYNTHTWFIRQNNVSPVQCKIKADHSGVQDKNWKNSLR